MSDELKLEEFRRWVLDVLDLMRSSPVRQLDYARRSGVGVDEIALQFDDAFHIAQARLRNASLNSDEFQWLSSVDGKLQSMIGSPSVVWSEGAVLTSSNWEELRDVANRARAELAYLWK